MNSLDYVLYKTRKTVRSACEELLLNPDTTPLVHSLELIPCSSCGIWLKFTQLIKDQDNLEICRDCLNAYGS
jgi:hypothetical protein